MRNPVRKFVGVTLMAVLGALALPMAVAGAQQVPGEGPAPAAPECQILSITPNPVEAFPQVVTVAGTVGGNVHLTLYGQTPPTTGTKVALAEKDVTAGSFSISANLTAPTALSVGFTFGNQNAYTAGCAQTGGEVVARVAAAEAVRPALAFTGSSDTPSYVLIGVAAVVVGAVLVVAARRRKQVS